VHEEILESGSVFRNVEARTMQPGIAAAKTWTFVAGVKA
jgi:hypothetical protein